jgi:hypothetical protein
MRLRVNIIKNTVYKHFQKRLFKHITDENNIDYLQFKQ